MPAPFLLYHWSPQDRRKAIIRRGLDPSSRSVDGLWRPPYVCFSASPSLAWALSARSNGRHIDVWDLWTVWSDVPSGYEEITDTYVDTGRSYVKEYRVYERIYKSDLWYVGSRTQSGERST